MGCGCSYTTNPSSKGCSRKARKNPPYDVYMSTYDMVRSGVGSMDKALELASYRAKSAGAWNDDDDVSFSIYDTASGSGRGQFVAMVKPYRANARKTRGSRRKSKSRSYKANGATTSLLALGLLAAAAWWLLGRPQTPRG